MGFNNRKLFIGVFILLTYVGIGVFGLLKFSHKSEMPMPNCLYSQGSFSLCENNFAHINNWRQFSKAVIPFILILSLLVLGVILYFYNKQNFLKQNQYFYRWKYYLYNKKLDTYNNKIIKWLSLFENSPPLSY
ncbi:MAG TPA: hypothetical protein VJC14_00990 [Candidatus Paceibacterota bacterium]